MTVKLDGPMGLGKIGMGPGKRRPNDVRFITWRDPSV